MTFVKRHIGNKIYQQIKMYKYLGETNESLMKKIIPSNILGSFKSFKSNSEEDSLKLLNSKFNNTNINLVDNFYEIPNKFKLQNKHFMIGLDYQESKLPNVITRNLLENPKWYTAYTPYQAEISQGRLESLFNFQTLISELTKLPVVNCSLLDTGSASVEALNIAFSQSKNRNSFFCSQDVHPHLLEILKTRAKILDIDLIIDKVENININDNLFGFYFSYPNTYGHIDLHNEVIEELKKNNTIVISQNDIMSLLLLKPPGELGVDISLGSTQRFGLPLWYGGPHSTFFAMDQKYLRKMPGRIIGESIDKYGNKGYRMALQTREQHIRKDKATSNICTSQALLANTSSMYAIYHGKEGLLNIVENIVRNRIILESSIKNLGFEVISNSNFDTVIIKLDSDTLDNIYNYLLYEVNIETRKTNNGLLLAINETTDENVINSIVNSLYQWINDTKFNSISNLVANSVDSFNSNNGNDGNSGNDSNYNNDIIDINTYLDESLLRNDDFLEQSIFKNAKSETEMLRYLTELVKKDYSLTEGMIPLGSCTMKLNSTSEMIPLSWNSIQNQHPFQRHMPDGYSEMINELSEYLKDITGLDEINYQSNAGSMGEYSGLLSIQKYHQMNSKTERNICLIPESAHGTNFASAKLVNLKIVKFNENMTIEEFRDFVSNYKDNLSSLMITYPNTYGIFDENIKQIIDIIHQNGGLVYMDGANMNAQCGYTSPGDCGADVCHLNLHKTFCIPHGGGGPGMGPIAVNNKLIPYLPSNNIQYPDYYDNDDTLGMITASNFGSASILSIPYMYFKMMGSKGIRTATEQAILNANYLKKKLENDYTIYSVNENGFVGHEFIIDLSEFKSIGISDKDIAKRIIDYSFHPPTMSWPVANSIMIEPTESEDLEELDRFVEAMLNIREELREIERGDYPSNNNVLVNAPHTYNDLINWNYSYSPEKGVFPVENLKKSKHWPTHNRIDDVYGDKHLKLKLD